MSGDEELDFPGLIEGRSAGATGMEGPGFTVGSYCRLLSVVLSIQGGKFRHGLERRTADRVIRQ